MKTIILTCFCLLFSFTLCLGQEELNQLDEEGKKHGVWEKNYPNDQLRYRGQFDHGEPIGTFFYYYDTGEKSSRVEHRDSGKADVLFFHKNGTVMGEGKYQDQDKIDVWKFYDDHSILSSVEPYEDGNLHGLVKVYHLNGELAAEIPYEHGLKNGPFKEYSTNGNVRIEGTYADGTYDGEYKQYFEDGDIYMSGWYKTAVKDSIWKVYSDEGRLKYQQLYDNGELIKQKIEEGFEKEKVEMEVDEEDRIDEEQLMEEFMNGGPPR